MKTTEAYRIFVKALDADNRADVSKALADAIRNGEWSPLDAVFAESDGFDQTAIVEAVTELFEKSDNTSELLKKANICSLELVQAVYSKTTSYASSRAFIKAVNESIHRFRFAIDFNNSDIVIDTLGDCDNFIYVESEDAYTTHTNDYVWCETEMVYAHYDDIATVDGEDYTRHYVEENFTWCESCEEYHRSDICGCSPSLFSSSANVLLNAGKRYQYVDVDSKTNAAVYKALDKTPKPRTYGVELEYSDLYPCQLSAATQGDTYIIKEDGTGGVTGEINTIPFTFAAREKMTEFSKLIRSLENEGATTEDCCGIHIHVSRNRTSDLQIAKLELVLDHDLDFCQGIAGRHYSSNGYVGKSDNANKFKPSRKKKTSKYVPVNYLHATTFEIRIFASMLDFKNVLAKVEFLESFLEFSNSFGILDFKYNTLIQLGFPQFIEKNKKTYPNFHKMLVDLNYLNKKQEPKKCA